ENRENIERFKREVETDSKIIEISAVTGDGINELNYAIIDALENYVPEEEEVEVDKDVRDVYRHEKQERSFEIKRGMDGKDEIHGDEIETLLMSTDFSRDAPVRMFARQIIC